MMTDNQRAEPLLRTLRSFVRRQGRLTAGQQAALDTLMPIWGVPEQPEAIDMSELFGNNNPVILEIGFGNGESLLQNAIDNPDQNYLGIEVHRPGVGHLLMRIDESTVSNIRVLAMDAIVVIDQRLATNSISGVQIFFPDPWPKKRHHKRRLVQTVFLDLLVQKLKPEAWFHMATDWEPYAVQMLRVTDAHSAFINQKGIGQYCERPDSRPQTKFERRGQRLGHGVYDLMFTKQSI